MPAPADELLTGANPAADAGLAAAIESAPAADTATAAKTPQRFTTRVRRGLRFVLDAGLRRRMLELIEERKDPRVKRAERLTADETSDIMAMLDWIEQEAAPTGGVA